MGSVREMSEELIACRISPASTAVLPLVGLFARRLFSLVRRASLALSNDALSCLSLCLSRSGVCDFVNEFHERRYFLSFFVAYLNLGL